MHYVAYCYFKNYADHVELGMDHFNEVQALIWEARPRYQSLAYGLGLSPATVSAIRQDNRDDTEKCFYGVLEEVLKKGVSRNKLAAVLESRQLGYTLLAKKVREAKFGKLLLHELYVRYSLLTLVLIVLRLSS